MTVTITIDCDNAAFEDRDTELARILRRLAHRIERGELENIGKLMDINGNSVGRMEVQS